jgi:hypothetical protein
MGVVQSKVTAINMLILKSFLKSWRVEIERFFDRDRAPNRKAGRPRKMLPPRCR